MENTEQNLHEEKCERCGDNHAEEDHECPYASEIHGNYDLCNCCSSCTGNCADDI